MDPIEMLKLGVEAYLRELPLSEFHDLCGRARPPGELVLDQGRRRQ